MLKKSKLNKCNVPKLNEIVQAETNAQYITTIVDVMRQKNQKSIQSKQQIKQQIEQVRAKMQKIIHEMNSMTSDRIQKKVKTVMDKNSRPQATDIKQFADLYTYMENQSKLTNRNTKQTELITGQMQNHNKEIQKKSHFVGNYSDLDEQYYQLNEQCARQLIVKDQIIKQRDEKRRFYESIESNIEQCRVQYELVEDKIRTAERQLIHLTGYFENRSQEQEEFIKELKMQATSLEDKILKAQQMLNIHNLRRQSLFIKDIQTIYRVTN